MDKEVLMSGTHPNLKEIEWPKTKKCINEFREKSNKRNAGNEFKLNDKNKQKWRAK